MALNVNMFMTLDQVMQGPGSSGEDDEGGFEHSGWQAQFGDRESGRLILEQILSMDALLIGRKTYDIWAKYWPFAEPGDTIGAHINSVPRYVASRTLDDPTWAGTTIIRDVPTEVAALKQTHESLMLFGSGDLLQTLLTHDLVDGFNLWMFPLTLGSGKRVFRDGAIPATFDLAVPPVSFESGSVLLTYRRAGAVAYGEMSSADVE